MKFGENRQQKIQPTIYRDWFKDISSMNFALCKQFWWFQWFFQLHANSYPLQHNHTTQSYWTKTPKGDREQVKF